MTNYVYCQHYCAAVHADVSVKPALWTPGPNVPRPLSTSSASRDAWSQRATAGTPLSSNARATRAGSVAGSTTESMTGVGLGPTISTQSSSSTSIVLLENEFRSMRAMPCQLPTEISALLNDVDLEGTTITIFLKLEMHGF